MVRSLASALLSAVVLFLAAVISLPATAADPALLDHSLRKLASDDEVNLGDEYGGKVVLVVNTASRCGNPTQ